MQVGKFLKSIESADPNKAVQGDLFFLKINKRAGQIEEHMLDLNMQGDFFSKTINVQTEIRPCRGEFFLKINERACTSIRHTRVGELV